MSIKSEILTLQQIRFDLSFKIAEIERVIDKAKKDVAVREDIAGSEWALEDLRQLYDETTHELQTNSHYTRTYPALCAIGMTDDVKAELLGNEADKEEKRMKITTKLMNVSVRLEDEQVILIGDLHPHPSVDLPSHIKIYVYGEAKRKCLELHRRANLPAPVDTPLPDSLEVTLEGDFRGFEIVDVAESV